MTDLPQVTISTTAPPPDWALWERYLLDGFYPAAMEFVEKYTRADGTLIWREAWPGMDGSDDGYESFGNFPLWIGSQAVLDGLPPELAFGAPLDAVADVVALSLRDLGEILV